MSSTVLLRFLCFLRLFSSTDFVSFSFDFIFDVLSFSGDSISSPVSTITSLRRLLRVDLLLSRELRRILDLIETGVLGISSETVESSLSTSVRIFGENVPF